MFCQGVNRLFVGYFKLLESRTAPRKAYFAEVFEKHSETFEKLGVNANNGLGDLYKKIATLPEEERLAIEADIKATYEKQPPMATRKKLLESF